MVYLALQPTGFLGRALGAKANLVIDAGSSFDVGGRVWRNFAQGGEEKGRMLLPVINQVKTLSPSLIRIDHIYDFYDVVGGGGGGLTFDWTKLDLTIGDILSTGAKPFISLSYMPSALGEDILALPANWGEWETVVQKTIEHISGRDGLAVSGVYYEVWNEPDLFGKFKVKGDKSYLDLYLHSALGASRANNVLPYKLGGPATTALYKNWFDSLLNLAAANGLKLNFISWHRYSKDLDDFKSDWLNSRKWLSRYPGYSNIELITSEMGPNSENDKVYDGNFGAIHTIATAALLENDLERGFLFEIKDGPGVDKYWGRWGMLTHENFGAPTAKPRYSAILFLNQMVGKKVNVAGEGSWVKAFAKENSGIIRVLVVNYDPAGVHYEAVPLTFINLPYNKFTFRRSDFLGGRKEILVSTTGTSWTTTEGMNPNSAAIFEIIPK
jgi:hypothetical protein